MNQRIRELAAQAELEVNAVFVWWPEGPEREDVVKEKLAELVAKEIMQVVANNLPSNTYLDVAEAVLEHFTE